MALIVKNIKIKYIIFKNLKNNILIKIECNSCYAHTDKANNICSCSTGFYLSSTTETCQNSKSC